MRIKVLLAAVTLPALATGAPAAHAQDVRACTIDHDGTSQNVNRWEFVPDAGPGLSGTWSATIAGRECIGTVGGSPSSTTIQGTYVGVPCLSAVLLGPATGVIEGGTVGYTHAGPDGAGSFLAIDSVHRFTFSDCNHATAFTAQVHLLP